MPVGTSVPLPSYTVDAAFIARKAEELGFDSLWYAEHPILPVGGSPPLKPCHHLAFCSTSKKSLTRRSSGTFEPGICSTKSVMSNVLPGPTAS